MQDEYMTVTEARLYLGISKKKIAELIAANVLETQPDQLDKRVKLVRRADVERLAAGSVKKGAA